MVGRVTTKENDKRNLQNMLQVASASVFGFFWRNSVDTKDAETITDLICQISPNRTAIPAAGFYLILVVKSGKGTGRWETVTLNETNRFICVQASWGRHERGGIAYSHS